MHQTKTRPRPSCKYGHKLPAKRSERHTDRQHLARLAARYAARPTAPSPVAS